MAALILVLHPDFTIASASDEYVRETLLGSAPIIGLNLFDVFPDNPGDPAADGVTKLRRSLDTVLRTRRADAMPLQRYDVRDRVGDGQQWIEKFWLPENDPVFGSGSQEITHVIHRVVDVTMGVGLQRWLGERALVIQEQHETIRRMQEDLERRAEALRAAQHRLATVMRAATSPDQFEALQHEVGAPEMRRYLPPGARAPVTGIYRAFHHAGCDHWETRVLMRERWAFHRCPVCRHRVLYGLLRRMP